MSFLGALNAALYSRLAGATALTSLLAGGTASPSVYYAVAPDEAPLPLVVFSLQAGGDENQTPVRAVNALVYVRAFASAPTTAAQIDKQIDAVLYDAPLSVDGWANFWIARETASAAVERLPNGELVYSSGAFYRVRLDES